jgi:hypothetical protein
MANLYATTVGSTTFGANALGAKTTSFENFGTRELVHLKIAGTLSASAVDISSANFRAAVIRGVQLYAETFGIGVTDPSSPYDLVITVADDTANGADSGNTQGTGFGLMEAGILAQVNAVTAGTLDAVAVTRYSQFTGDILAT